MSNAILKGRELDIRKIENLSYDALYQVNNSEFSVNSPAQNNLCYYNCDEIFYFYWGYIASKYLNFQLPNDAIAFGMRYLDREKVISQDVNMTPDDYPWKIKAIYDGWNSATNGTNNEIINMYNPYSFQLGYDIDGFSTSDAFELVLWTYTGLTASLEKVTTKISTKILYTALIDWSFQVSLNMINGDNFETASQKVSYGKILYSGLSGLIKNNPTKMTLSCLKTVTDNSIKYKELRLEKSIALCFIDLLTNSTTKVLLTDKNSPYYNLLQNVFKNKNAQVILKNLRKMGFSDENIMEFSSILPSTMIKDIVKLLKNKI